jgi:serine/threonine protein kinase
MITSLFFVKANRFAQHIQLSLFRDASFLLTTHNDQPSFLEIGTVYERGTKFPGKMMEEAVVLFYAAELLRATEELHKCGIIHGNISPSNVLVREKQKQFLCNTS